MNKDLLKLINKYISNLSFKSENDYKIYNQFVLNVKNKQENKKKCLLIYTTDDKKKLLKQEINKELKIEWNPSIENIYNWSNKTIAFDSFKKIPSYIPSNSIDYKTNYLRNMLTNDYVTLFEKGKQIIFTCNVIVFVDCSLNNKRLFDLCEIISY